MKSALYRLFFRLSCFLLLVLAACAPGLPEDLKAPYVFLSSVAPAGDMTVFEQRYEVGLRIQNPNDVPLPVAGMKYALILNGQEFARGVGGEKTVIPALGEGVVRVTVTSGALDWIGQIGRLQNAPDGSLSYELAGELYLQGRPGRPLPFSESGRFPPSSGR